MSLKIGLRPKFIEIRVLGGGLGKESYHGLNIESKISDFSIFEGTIKMVAFEGAPQPRGIPRGQGNGYLK